jgi:ABC-type branched-subunit amino acid transport system ATPase component
MVIIEQNLKLALAVADRCLILRDGRIALQHRMGDGAPGEEAIARSIYL